jgi:hypothetical protein
MTRKTLLYFIILLLPATFCLNSCGDKGEGAPDVSNIKVQVVTQRFDLDIYGLDSNHLADGLTKLHSKYPDFLDFFLDTVMGFGIQGNGVYNDTSKGIREAVHEYITHKDYVGLEDTIKKNFPDTRETDEHVAMAFRYMKHYFPSIPVPKIIYINHLLQNISALSVDTGLSCICLDMFLGRAYPNYAAVGMPAYMAPHHDKNYIPVALFKDIYQSTYHYLSDDHTLLDRMIQRGKEQYFLHKIMPGTPDSVLFGFHGNQVDWCNKNEAGLYNFFIQQNLLYNKEERAIGTYVVDGPYAKNIGAPTDVGNPTPGNVGTWLGYKIVCSFIAQNPKITLKELLSLKTEPTQFLEGAKYKPR